MELRQQIQLRYESLSPQLKQAAKYVSQNTEQVATHSLRQVAQMAGFAPPTFSRLARALGFASYEELRDLSRLDLSNRRQSFGEKAEALQSYQQGGELIGKGTFVIAQAASAIDNIQRLVDGIDPTQLTSAAEKLTKARKVYLAGYQSSRPLMSYLNYTATMAFDSWEILDLEHASASKQLYTLNEKDVVISLVIAPFSRRVVELMRRAAEKKATLISISDSVHSPVCSVADYSFIATTDSPHFFASYVAPMVLMESLIAMVVRRGSKAAASRIAGVEQLNYDLGEYWLQE